MPRPPSDSVQIAIRIPRSWLTDADKAAQAISQPGFQATRTDAFRAAIARGLGAILADATARQEPAPKLPKRSSK